MSKASSREAKLNTTNNNIPRGAVDANKEETAQPVKHHLLQESPPAGSTMSSSTAADASRQSRRIQAA
jgi:hypothetical protein